MSTTSSKRRLGNCKNCGDDVDFYVSNSACVACQTKRSRQSYNKRVSSEESAAGGGGGKEKSLSQDIADFSRAFNRAVGGAKSFPIGVKLKLSVYVNQMLSEMSSSTAQEKPQHPHPQPHKKRHVEEADHDDLADADADADAANADEDDAKDDDDDAAVSEIEAHMETMKKAGATSDYYVLSNASR